jgi:drug/metabolite transporter (DMT)-like permease
MYSTPSTYSFFRGAFWATLTAISFAVMITAVHFMDGKFDAFQIVFFRAIVGLLLIVPLVLRSGLKPLLTNKLPLHCVRTFFGLFAMAALYYAVAAKPLAEIIALTFLIPIFVTISSGVVLRETVGIHRWLATIFGFGGALVIIRPGFIEFDLPIFLALLSSALYAGAWSTVKVLTRTEQASIMLFWLNFLMLPLTIVPTVFVWVTPDWNDLVPILIMSLFGWSAHFCQAKAFEKADASAVMPFDFIRLPVAALFGYFLFSEALDLWIWVGAIIIFTASYYSVWREKINS